MQTGTFGGVGGSPAGLRVGTSIAREEEGAATVGYQDDIHHQVAHCRHGYKN